jgi:hypothetical protein
MGVGGVVSLETASPADTAKMDGAACLAQRNR